MNSRTIGNVTEHLMWRLENLTTTNAALTRKKAPKKGGSEITYDVLYMSQWEYNIVNFTYCKIINS